MSLHAELEAAKNAVAKACRLCSLVQAELASGHSHQKADNSPVTVADYGSQALILRDLKGAFPNDPAVAEEDAAELRSPENKTLLESIVRFARQIDSSIDAADALASIDRGNHSGGKRGRFWTLDPIDGTKGFLRGEQYAVALALIVDGQVQLGVLGCPNLPTNPSDANSELGCLLYATRGGGAWQVPISRPNAAEAIRVDAIADPALAVFCESVEAGHTAHGRSARILETLGNRAEPLRIDSQCKYAAVARGQASAYLRLPTRRGYEEKIWDHAAGWIILSEAGGSICDTEGKRLDFSLGRTLAANPGIVAASPLVFDAIAQAVQASQDGDDPVS